MKSYSKNEMCLALSSALNETTNRHSRIAYKFVLGLVNNLTDSVQFTIRATTNALNLGDIIECIIKVAITDEDLQRYSLATERDIDRARKNEVKAFVNSNRYPNALATPQGFLAISKYGVHYITKSLCVKYWNDERVHIDSDNGKQFTLAILKDMISDGARLDATLTEKLMGSASDSDE